ncbi:hypothetical protein EJB05_16744, partial [Eragrostis curvula]
MDRSTKCSFIIQKKSLTLKYEGQAEQEKNRENNTSKQFLLTYYLQILIIEDTLFTIFVTEKFFSMTFGFQKVSHQIDRAYLRMIQKVT